MSNRKYLYRGKQENNGEWVEGFYYKDIWGDNTEYITYDGENFEVIPETVGQCTGLKDKNDKKIFEGDIVRFFEQIGTIDESNGAFGILCDKYIDFDMLDSEIATVTGCNNSPYFLRIDNFVSLLEMMWNYNQEEIVCEVVEVIGNIHDNPELMEE